MVLQISDQNLLSLNKLPSGWTYLVTGGRDQKTSAMVLMLLEKKQSMARICKLTGSSLGERDQRKSGFWPDEAAWVGRSGAEPCLADRFPLASYGTVGTDHGTECNNRKL